MHYDIENVDDGDVCHDISKCDVLTTIGTKHCLAQTQRKLVVVISTHVPMIGAQILYIKKKKN